MAKIDPPLKWHGPEPPDPRPVKGFPGYRVWADGRVQSCWRFKGGGLGRTPEWYLSEEWKTLKPDPDKRGRKRVTVRFGRRSVKLRVSRVVIESFVGPAPAGMECCHENGNETDDRLSNLRWDTHSGNLLDRRRHGTNVEGEKVNTAKLTAADVAEIRRIGRPLKPLAERFGVSETQISNILNRRSWTHV